MNRLRENLLEIRYRITLIEEFTQGGRELFMSTPMIQESVIRCFEVMARSSKRSMMRFLNNR